MSKEGKGSLLFSNDLREITGYLVINGDEYEIVGWRPSPIRAEITARPIGQRQAEQQANDAGSEEGTRECDPA